MQRIWNSWARLIASLAMVLCIFASSTPVSAKPLRKARMSKGTKAAKPMKAKRKLAKNRPARAKGPRAPQDDGITTQSETKQEAELPKINNAPAAKVEGDGKVIRFSGLSVEGNVKSLQLGYFIDRVRTEFDRPRLPHRSFVPELEHSAKEKHF